MCGGNRTDEGWGMGRRSASSDNRSGIILVRIESMQGSRYAK